jgi:NitT/TauT family transport system ATP-binding protein
MSVTAAPALEFKNVSLAYGGTTQSTHVVLNALDLRVADGEFVCFVGPTGCGKSTLLNIAAGLLRPSSGSVQVFGQELAGLNRQAGYLFQTDALLPWRTAADNVAAGLVFRGIALPEARTQAQAWLARVGLTGFGDRYPHQLSGGMKKRVALAQVLVLDPKIILMDEPFSALDVQTRSLMENQLLDLWSVPSTGEQSPSDARKSVLFITHDLEEAIALADRVVLLSAGPGSRIIGDYPITLPRPRDVAEIRMDEDFVALHREIWQALRTEVQRAHAHS